MTNPNPNPNPQPGDWVRAYSGPTFRWIEGELLERDQAAAEFEAEEFEVESLRVPGEATPYLVERSTVTLAERPGADRPSPAVALVQRAALNDMTARQVAAFLRDVHALIVKGFAHGPHEPGNQVWRIAAHLGGLAEEIGDTEQAAKVRYYRRPSGTKAKRMYYRQREGAPFEVWHAYAREWEESVASGIAKLREMWSGEVEEIPAAELPAGVAR
jgi:hypothetical protein